MGQGRRGIVPGVSESPQSGPPPDLLIEVEFRPGSQRVWFRAGVTLLEAAEGAGVDILTGCTRGMCGTDPVRVLDGAAGLQSASDHEAGTLERMGVAAPEYRLACSARLAGEGPIVVELDPL